MPRRGTAAAIGPALPIAPVEKTFYTVPQLLALLEMKAGTFADLRSRGKLPFLEELLPRLGKSPRYRRDLVDRYLAGQWGVPRAYGRGGVR